MQHPTCTVPTDAIREGERRLAAWTFGFFFVAPTAIMTVLFFAHQSNNVLALLGWAAFAFALAMFLYMSIPRMIIRVSPWGIRIRSWGFWRNHSVQWEAIEACFHGTTRIGFKYDGRELTLGKQTFKKRDWTKLYATMSHYFDYLFEITLDSERSRRRELLRPKSVGEFLLDKLALIVAGMWPFAFMTGYFAAVSLPRYRVAIIIAFLALTTLSFFIMRKQFKLAEQLQWRAV